MGKILFLAFILLPLSTIAQNNLIYKAEKEHTIKIGKYKYTIRIESAYYPEGKEAGFSEVLIKDNKKQYIGHFLYQLKSSTEISISSHNPSPVQIENRILQSYNALFDDEKEHIIVTTNFYDEKEPREKEIRTLQQSKKGFFYLKQKQTYFKNGEMKEEKDLPEKIELVKIKF